MRCDDQPNGCNPCMQNRTPCKTTDRITGKATVRGYVQSLERQLEDLQKRTQDLENRLLALGEDIKPYTKYGDAPMGPVPEENRAQAPEHIRGGVDSDSLVAMPRPNNKRFKEELNNIPYSPVENHPPRLPDFQTGLAGNNYLGVSTGNSLLSSIRGTSMSVLGMEIDLADYMSADADEPDMSRTKTQPVYNKSYRAFVQTAFGTSPKLNKVELPPRSEGMNYAHVYFRLTNPYLPIVHKPSFMTTVSQRQLPFILYHMLTYSSSSVSMTILRSSLQ